MIRDSLIVIIKSLSASSPANSHVSFKATINTIRNHPLYDKLYLPSFSIYGQTAYCTFGVCCALEQNSFELYLPQLLQYSSFFVHFSGTSSLYSKDKSVCLKLYTKS